MFWSVARFWTELFSLRKKKLFFIQVMSDCLSNFDWSFVPLFNPLSSAAFLEDEGQRTKVLISYLHQGVLPQK
jgi:hypothetical protein